MWIAATSLILSFYALSVVPSCIIRQGAPSPSPQWGDIHLGVFRFVNLDTGEALAAYDNHEDAWIVTKPIADNDNTQRWHVIDPTKKPGLSFLNNGTGKFLTGTGKENPVKARRGIPENWDAIWYTEHRWFEDVPEAIYIYVQNLDMEGALDIRDDGTGSTIVIMTGIGDAGQIRSQGWRPEYLGT